MLNVLATITIMLLSYTEVHKYTPYTIEGTVQDEATGQPLKFVHVFSVKGEEEAMTDGKGTFSFKSWNENIVLTAEATGYQKRERKLKLPVTKQAIFLRKE